jgi:hypothetical protein
MPLTMLSMLLLAARKRVCANWQHAATLGSDDDHLCARLEGRAELAEQGTSGGAKVVLGCVLAALAAIVLVGVVDVVAARLGRGKVDTASDGVSGSHGGAMIKSLFLMAFAIGLIVPWTTNDTARQNTYAESQAIVEAYWQANRLPAAEAAIVHSDLRNYTNYVINGEWPVLGTGQLSQQGWTMLDSLRGNLMSVNYPDKPSADADTAVVSHVSEVYAARRQRAVDAAATLPEAVIIFAVITGLLVILYPFLAGVRPHGKALLPILLTSALIGAGLFLVIDNNHTFSGGIAVKPDAFQSALIEMQRVQ